MSDQKQYLGVTFKAPDNSVIKAVYPEGTFSIINQGGKLALQTVGAAPDQAMAVDTMQVFTSLETATYWINLPNSN